MARLGMGIRQFARELDRSRTMVTWYRHDARAPRYSPREARAAKLDASKGYVGEWIAAARPHWIPAVVLLRETRASLLLCPSGLSSQSIRRQFTEAFLVGARKFAKVPEPPVERLCGDRG
jgi:hypothetical protein